MNKGIKIAIIDNGVNELYIKRSIEESIAIDENGICIGEPKNIDHQNFQHGTNCAMILEKYCTDCHLISIKILDENGRGAIKSIYPALEWCYKNRIRLINLSLGTVDFRDCEKLKALINEYAVKGMIIIAATANSGFVSYPASFTNIIGVATIDSPLNYFRDYMQMGIDAIVPSEHSVNICGKEIKTSLCNSYATSYMCALIANKLGNDKTLNIVELKKYAKERSHIEMAEEGYEPDWIYRAYILDRENTSRGEYYFKAITGSYDEIQGEIDTVIAYTMTGLEDLDIKNKNLIYLGNENVHNIDVYGFVWSKETRQRQIKHNYYQGNGLEVPIVILAVEDKIDKFYVLTELKRVFANDGYNAYVIGMEPECVLYALEYMPEPASDIDAWKKFIESQIFYKQNNLVIWCVPLEDRDKYLKVYLDYDMQIILYSEGNSNIVKFFFEGEMIEKKIAGVIETKDIEEIYHIAESKLTEKENE